ncbi:g5074 [Coccomyxa viridis]|uniref:G5074 protein n=1 Tax=Coccomyxa viridis TaxID=1274662 RepID=A0ABP1FVV1_9CHLO
MATNGASMDGGFDDGRSFSDRRRAARTNIERTSFDIPQSEQHDDGYAPNTYSRSSMDGRKLHASGNSADDLTELAERQPEREPSVRRPPSMDLYKPRRSESEAPHGTYTAGKAVQSMTNPDGTARPAGHTDTDGYKSTTYYADRNKNESGYNMTGMNTSSSVGDMQTMDK